LFYQKNKNMALTLHKMNGPNEAFMAQHWMKGTYLHLLPVELLDEICKRVHAGLLTKKALELSWGDYWQMVDVRKNTRTYMRERVMMGYPLYLETFLKQGLNEWCREEGEGWVAFNNFWKLRGCGCASVIDCMTSTLLNCILENAPFFPDPTPAYSGPYSLGVYPYTVSDLRAPDGIAAAALWRPCNQCGGVQRVRPVIFSMTNIINNDPTHFHPHPEMTALMINRLRNILRKTYSLRHVPPHLIHECPACPVKAVTIHSGVNIWMYLSKGRRGVTYNVTHLRDYCKKNGVPTRVHGRRLTRQELVQMYYTGDINRRIGQMPMHHNKD